mgnify:CR=1 FL=1|tara:strand:+ start:613 stop:1542 length:930 start_codon:yes stop_codon:yes gene_type:complete
MKINKPKFWNDKKHLFVFFLLPFSLVYYLIIFFRRKLIKPKSLNIPIVCVGNIYVGGTGKTPTSIQICNELTKRSKKTALVRKYYKSHKDEHLLINNYYKGLILGADRILAIEEAKRKKFQVIVLDDGLQDLKIKKNFNIVCFNQNQLIGNGYVFPAGPLRENIRTLENSHAIIINGVKSPDFEKKIFEINSKIEIFYSKYNPLNISDFKNKNLLALASIGNPQNFFDLLSENNLIIKKKIVFPDHYEFNKDEISDIISIAKRNSYQIIMTEKDFYKFKDFETQELKYLKVELKLDNQKKLIDMIMKSL